MGGHSARSSTGTPPGLIHNTSTSHFQTIRPQHKISCKGIKAFLDLEATVMALCGSPFILHHLRAGIAIALDLVDPDPDSEETINQKHECRVVPIKLTIHPLSEADTLAFALGKRTIQGKGPDSNIPGFVALHTMESDELVRSVDFLDVANANDGEGDNSKENDLESEQPRVIMTGSKSTEVDRGDQKRYRALWKQVREQRAAERAAHPAPSEQHKEGESVPKYDILYEFDPDPVVLVDFEYENDRCTVALEITPDALETALCEKLSDGDEKLLEQIGVDLPEEWELFDMIV